MQKPYDSVWILYLLIWNRDVANILSIFKIPKSLVNLQKVFFQKVKTLAKLFLITLFLDKQLVGFISAIVDGFFRKNVGFRTIENHSVFNSDAQSRCKMDTELHHLTESNWNLLIVNSNHARLLNGLKLEQRFVELLALGTKENGEQVI